ncbi:hypothetical protein TWF225_005477 [Orbilia oligospora]|nr:hypothetical protein TWF225_005477 [Orbilia oligospora]KAF3259893.1 hypothetical protein TWF128_003883 [Orbilia oligospora]KAF3270799.1 hypothetical protein TWF217_007074 [Orbilia oligospora]KAF3292284.1 hypothetical protein TWF132_005674 [Orbilia oligospora]
MTQSKTSGEGSRSKRSRSKSPFSSKSDYCIENDIVPSSSSSEMNYQESEFDSGSERDNESRECDEEVKTNDCTEQNTEKEPLRATNTQSFREYDKYVEEYRRRPRRQRRRRFTGWDIDDRILPAATGILLTFLTFMVFVVMEYATALNTERHAKQLLEDEKANAEPIIETVTETVVEVISDINEIVGTYFGICGQNMNPCCFDTDNFVDQIKQEGLRSVKSGFSNALECWRHLRSSE